MWSDEGEEFELQLSAVAP